MRARDIVGKRVVRVSQQQFWNANIGQMCWSLDGIEFDDGTRLVLVAQESEFEPYVEGHVAKRQRS